MTASANVGRSADKVRREPLRVPETVRFWTKVDKGEGCWTWLGAVVRTGHGRFRVGDSHQLAHRYAYRLLVGPIPRGALLLHNCHNSRCVRPEHLRLGTFEDNTADMVESGRSKRCGKPLAKA